MTEDTFVAHFTAFTSDADLEINEDNEVENIDELHQAGKTYPETRCFADTEQNRKHLTDDMIVEPGDPKWKDVYDDMEPADTIVP